MLEGREWHGAAGARPEVLNELRSVAPVEISESYLGLLAFSDGGEGPLPVNPLNLCLDPAQVVIDGIRSANGGQSDLNGFLIFGGNGGGEYLAFDLRKGPPFPIVTIDTVGGSETAEFVARDFDEFVGLIGLDGGAHGEDQTGR